MSYLDHLGTVLVTGGSGFVGSAVVDRLIEEGFDVSVSIRHGSRLVSNKVRTNLVPSININTKWHEILVGVESVIHLAARVHIMNDAEIDPLRAFRVVNVEGTLNLARQAVDAGVKRFIFVSSIKVNGEWTADGQPFIESDIPDPKDAYAQSKYEAEIGLRDLAIATGLEVVIIRPPLVYGPGVKANFAALMRAVTRGLPLPLGAVSNKRSLVGLDNLVDFIFTCLVHPRAANQTFLVSDGYDLSTPELINYLAKFSERPLRLFSLPISILQVSATLLGKGANVRRLCGNLQVDISKARKQLEWAPPVSIQEGLRRALECEINLR